MLIKFKAKKLFIFLKSGVLLMKINTDGLSTELDPIQVQQQTHPRLHALVKINPSLLGHYNKPTHSKPISNMSF